MTHLRKIMLEELQRGNYSEITTRKYSQYVTAFARHFAKSPDQLGPNQLRSYPAYLLQERKVTPGTYRPGFRIYTGNDLGVNMIECGSDYLLGLAAFAPEKFAERDRLWQAGDLEYYALSDALQHLGNVAFRAPIPAYKHSAAVFLKLIGRIPSNRTHPLNPQRPAWESEILTDCAHRLSLL